MVNPLTVAYNRSGKPRHVNFHLHKYRYIYEDAEVARDVFDIGDFVFTFDLKSAYHHISIFAEHRQHLGFSWNINGRQKYYVFNVLPFGLSTAGYNFSKVTRHFVKYMRSNNVKIVMYLDDGVCGSSSQTVAFRVSCYIRDEVQKF